MDERQSNQNLQHLIKIYQDAEDDHIALFLGAGVNGGAKNPACASWPKLLMDVGRHFYQENQVEAILKNSDDNWIQAATKLIGEQDRSIVIDMIDNTIYKDAFIHPEKRSEKDPKHKVLEWNVLKKMNTLRAVVAFSAAINNPAKKRSMRRNPKLGRVLTTNYDFFFSAAWPRYRSMRKKWWPRTWRSKAGHLDGPRPIIYLHGYLPYSKKGECDVILTEDDYQRAYPEIEEGNTGFALREFRDAINHCHLIFIGFSFTDHQVVKLLKNSNSSKEHFAFFCKNETDAIERAKGVGVNPVTVMDWPELPEKLTQVYCAGLSEEELGRKKLSRAQYWSILWDRQGP